MVHLHRSSVAGLLAALAVGLVLVASQAAGQDEPPSKARPTRVQIELTNFRALEPDDRLKLVAKLAGATDAFTATRRGDLAAAVVERGTVEPVDYADLACQLKARSKEGAAATVWWVVEDGTMVKKGERVLTLDDTAVQDRHRAAAAKVKEADDALAAATEAVRVVQKEAAIAVKLGEIEVKLAEIELRTIPAGPAREGAELKVERAKLRLDRAWLRGKTRLAQAEADQRARAVARDVEVGTRKEAEDELKLCSLVAPLDGMAVYHVSRAGRFGGGLPPLAAGEGVREGQKLVRVVGLKQFAVGTRVHESQVATVRVGQAVRVRVDAFPARDLRGTVAQVSPVAAAPDWLAANVKVYPVTVTIEDPPPGLKPDMSCEVRVATGERKGVLLVPRTAVVVAGRDRVCFVKSGQELQERRVVIGAVGEATVEIREGLREGDLVAVDLPALLVRP
ncbi:MAG TPA: HlyD family efflux transporter periplasmic adaptor subunit [Urbifossiella sp.]|nr:HlyD family efflux transporter periplasmic adaptor subunit [Urbifossiella sp.]